MTPISLFGEHFSAALVNTSTASFDFKVWYTFYLQQQHNLKSCSILLANKAIQRNTFSGRAINDIRFSKQRLDLSSTSDRHSELVKGWSKKASVQMLYGKDAGYWDGENLVAQLKDIA